MRHWLRSNPRYAHEKPLANLSPRVLVYALELEINLVELNPAYPRAPKTLGEHIRKARMDKGLLIRELAALVGVSADTIINWERRSVRPKASVLDRLGAVLQLNLAATREQESIELTRKV